MISINEYGFNPPSVTAQQKGVRVVHGKPMFYTKPEVLEARAELAYHLKQYVPEKPLEGALSLRVSWIFLTKDKKKNDSFKSTRPDLDNLNKLLQDVMTDLGFFKDDAQIAKLHCRKLLRTNIELCGLSIRIKELK